MARRARRSQGKNMEGAKTNKTRGPRDPGRYNLTVVVITSPHARPRLSVCGLALCYPSLCLNGASCHTPLCASEAQSNTFRRLSRSLFIFGSWSLGQRAFLSLLQQTVHTPLSGGCCKTTALQTSNHRPCHRVRFGPFVPLRASSCGWV